MKISLVGYMGVGKSVIGRKLSDKLSVPFFDLDEIIELEEGISINQLFQTKGEIFFRKLEHNYLKKVVKNDNYILSTGGGTPVFYNNMDLINELSLSFYLQLSPIELAERLKAEKQKRPLISHLKNEDLTEFIAKHLFERNLFYQKAKNRINVKGKSVEVISDEIIDSVNKL